MEAKTNQPEGEFDSILQTIKEKMVNYESFTHNLFDIILWERSFVLVLILLIINSLILYSYFSQIGILAFLILLVLITYVLSLLFTRFGKFLENMFLPPLPPKDNTKNFNFMCNIFAKTIVFLKKAFEFMTGANYQPSLFKIGFIAVVWTLLAIVVNYISSIWVFLLCLNAILLLPGILHRESSKPHVD